jgi:hypothetical protein
MAIADVFEALTADDRPYKKAKKLSEAMRIMGFMKKDNHLDPDLFDVFIKSRMYLEYAKQNLAEHLIDEVDEDALLAMTPRSYDLPEQSQRIKRKGRFLPEYEERFPIRDASSPLAVSTVATTPPNRATDKASTS